MTAVADLVAQHTHGRLDVLVVTHRHKDHLFGFGVPEAAQALAGLAPRLVLRPWTEDPALAGDATGPAPRSAAGAKARAFVQQLAAAQDAADLAALAGASAMTRAEDPCSAAAFAAQHNDGVLSGCVARAEGSSFVVEVRVTAKLHPVIPGGQATVQRTAAAGTGPGMSTQ